MRQTCSESCKNELTRRASQKMLQVPFVHRVPHQFLFDVQYSFWEYGFTLLFFN
jgi:hypothetical protein